jgi:hypothetical protein
VCCPTGPRGRHRRRLGPGTTTRPRVLPRACRGSSIHFLHLLERQRKWRLRRVLRLQGPGAGWTPDKALRRVDADQPGPQRIADVEAFDAAHQAALHRRPGDAHDVLFIGFAIASDLRGWFAVAGWR